MIIIEKRNGKKETFAQGAIALAVFKAAESWMKIHQGKVNLVEARNIGSKIAKHVEIWADQQNKNHIPVDEIQDIVIEELKKWNMDWGIHYENYRKQKSKLREDSSLKRKDEKIFNFKTSDGSDFKISKRNWLEILEKSLNLGIKQEWTAIEWWESVEDEALKAKSYEELITIHLKKLLAMSLGRGNWLDSAGCLLVERWEFRILGGGILSIEHDDLIKRIKDKLKIKIKDKLKDKKWGWIINDDEMNYLLESINPKSLLKLGFHGISLIENQLPSNHDTLLEEIFVLSALSFARQFKDRHIEAAKTFLMLLMTARIVPPMNMLMTSLSQKESWVQEWAIKIEDDIISVYEALKQMAIIGREGGSISVDLSSLRSEGRPIGKDGNQSGGIRPILSLFNETGKILKNKTGEKQKARVFLKCWHADIENFLAVSRLMNGEMKPTITITDLFMKQVFNDGNWVLCSPELISGDENAWIESQLENKNNEVKYVKARDVLSWICQAIENGANIGVYFNGNAFCFGGDSDFIPSARMNSLIPYHNDLPSGAVEIGINFNGLKVSESKKVVDLVLTAIEGYQDKVKQKRQISLVPLGMESVDHFIEINNEIFQNRSIEIKETKESLWSYNDPFKKRLELIKEKRSGMVNFDYPQKEIKIRNNRIISGLWSISYREEYLALTKEIPCYLNEGYQVQIKFEEIKLGFSSGGEMLAMKNQVKKASDWQNIIDQGLTWDVRLNQKRESEIEEAIKWAWLNGMIGIRMFLPKNALFMN